MRRAAPSQRSVTEGPADRLQADGSGVPLGDRDKTNAAAPKTYASVSVTAAEATATLASRLIGRSPAAAP